MQIVVHADSKLFDYDWDAAEDPQVAQSLSTAKALELCATELLAPGTWKEQIHDTQHRIDHGQQNWQSVVHVVNYLWKTRLE